MRALGQGDIGDRGRGRRGRAAAGRGGRGQAELAPGGKVEGLWGKTLDVLGVIRKRDFFVLVIAVLTASQTPLTAFILCALGTYGSFVGIVANDIRIAKMIREGHSFNV